jgi:hypothetical protein
MMSYDGPVDAHGGLAAPILAEAAAADALVVGEGTVPA